ncbi:MAG: hypothetical protein AABN33_21855 [Acidobacteriota bacterium]
MPLRFEDFAGDNLEELDNPILSIALTPNAQLAVVGEARRYMSVWNTQWGELFDQSYDSRSATAVAMTPDGRRLLCRGKLGSDHAWSIQVWEIKWGIGRPFLRLMTLRRKLAPSMGLALSPDGRIAAWGEGGALHIWDIEKGEFLRTLDASSGEIQSLRFSPDGCLVASGGSRGVVNIWDVNTGCLHLQCGNSLVRYALAVMPDGRSLAAAGEDGSFFVFDMRSGTCPRTWQAHESEFNVIAVSSDCRKVVSGSLKDRTLRVWDLEGARRIAMTKLPFGVMALDLKRSLLAVGDHSGNVLFFYVRQLTGTPVVTPVRLWNFGMWSLYLPAGATAHERRQIHPSNWSDELTVFCDWCGKRCVPPVSVLDAIRGIAKNSKLEPGESPCLKLPDEAWDEPRLLSTCSLCHEQLKYNPFVVDNQGFPIVTN